MTRINVLPVNELTLPELRGEYKELPRAFTLIKARIAKGQQPSDIKGPVEYVLGQGHVKFFFTRVKYLADRFTALTERMLDQGYNVNLEMYNDIMDDIELSIPGVWWNDYTPTDDAIAINTQRMIDNGTR
ncbi:putative Pyrimidine dimer DNA glycosylase [Vibrio phage 393E50-1]|nr:putative Pyrimidine dimer DNA glycosylase [Vibrio phage 393E50-1]